MPEHASVKQESIGEKSKTVLERYESRVTNNRGNGFSTPLRYPGGKGRLGPWLSRVMRHNRMSGGCYVEPYAGGGGVATYLLTRGYVDHIMINDLDPAIHAFWWSVLHDTDAFVELVRRTPVTIESWERQKAVHGKLQDHSTTEVGFATFFLNRTNRSGILTGGVIGGKKQLGNFSIDARFNKTDLIDRIREIASLKRHISLFCEDAVELIVGLKGELSGRSLIYLDPPYFHKGKQLYRKYYKPKDHDVIRTTIGQIDTPWIMTYDNCPEIRNLYDVCQSAEFSMRYSVSGKRTAGSEILFYGNLVLPELPTLSKSG